MVAFTCLYEFVASARSVVSYQARAEERAFVVAACHVKMYFFLLMFTVTFWLLLLRQNGADL